MSKAHNGARYRNAVQMQRRKRLPCSLCGKPIDYSLPVNDAWAFSLEHVIAVSRGGSLLDPRNHASAHRACNRAAGNKQKASVMSRPAVVTSRDW